VVDRIRRGAIAILVTSIIVAAACMVFALVEGLRHQPLWLLAVPVLVWAILRQASGLRRISRGTYGDRTGRQDQ
jgi:hypothetical protein